MSTTEGLRALRGAIRDAADAHDQINWGQLRKQAERVLGELLSPRMGIMRAECCLALHVIERGRAIQASQKPTTDWLDEAQTALEGCTGHRARELRSLIDYDRGLHHLSKVRALHNTQQPDEDSVRAVELLITAAEGMARMPRVRRWRCLAYAYAAQGAHDLKWHKTALLCAKQLVRTLPYANVHRNDSWHHGAASRIARGDKEPIFPTVWDQHLYDFSDVA